jgi:N-acetylmuramoyl-L-alanine amidase
MLLYNVTHVADRSIISLFFQSPVKRRLLMLTQQAKGSYGFLRRFMSIPILFTAVLLLSADTKEPATAKRSAKKIVLVLDAAHGGEDAGGKGIYGHLEKDLTLTISKELVALSGEYNIEVIPTRSADVNATLEERVRTSNGNNDAVFLSIHVSKGTATEKQNTNYELGVNPNSKDYNKSILLASSIANKLKTQKLPVTVVEQKAFVLRENNHPALIMECGNIDDADNIAMLSDEVRTETLCRNILSGIVDYSAKLGTK